MNKIISTEITESNIAHVIDLLSDTPKKLGSLRSRFSDEQYTKPLGAGERSLTENLAHLLHSEAISSEFIYLAILKNEVLFHNLHPEREYGKLLRYDLFPFETLLDYFIFRRTALLRVLSSLEPKQWSGSLSEKGKKRKESVYWRARSIALHELEHIMDIEKKLGKEFLYKVSKPRTDMVFEPSRFWRAPDWSFSDEHEHAGFVEDCVLFAGEFDEVNIHLLPKVWRLRVWLDDENRLERLRKLGYSWSSGSRAIIFALESDRDAIETFSPTIFSFDRSGFELTPSNEYISRTPQAAVSTETIPFYEAVLRWQFEMVFVKDAKSLEQAFRSNHIDHQIQT
jgi:hypothetical protein